MNINLARETFKELIVKKFVVLTLFIMSALLAACNIQPTTPMPKDETAIESQAKVWYLLGDRVNSQNTLATNASLAVGNSNKLFLAWQEMSSGFDRSIYVKQWDGNFWTQLGSVLDMDATMPAYEPSLALDSGEQPVVAWSEPDRANDFHIFVKYWNGTEWSRVGSALDVNPGWASFGPSLALDKTNNPVVAWYERNIGTTSSNIYVKRWNGSSWLQLGSALNVQTTQLAKDPTLAIDASGNPVVAWSEKDSVSSNIYVKRWNGTSWVSLGSALDMRADQDADVPSIKVDSSNNPVVAWEENLSPSCCPDIYVKRWNGTTWQAIGPGLRNTNSGISTNPSLALDAANTPTIAWEDYNGDTESIRVSKWNGSRWVSLSASLSIDATRITSLPALALDKNGLPSVVWEENVGGFNTALYVKRFISNGWQPLGKPLDINLANDATLSSITRKSNDHPVVTWQEFGNIYAKEWTGSSWLRLGTKLNSNNGSNPVITMRSDDKPVIAWSESDAIWVKYWNGTAWQSQGTIPMNSVWSLALAVGSGNNPIVAYSTFGNDGEATNLYVKRWNGTAWVGMNGSTTVAPLDMDITLDASVPSLGVDSTGKPTVAWAEGLGLSSSIYVKRWTGTAWVQLGANLETASANNPSLDLDRTGKPVVAWQERVFDGANTQTNIYIKRWDGTAWVKYGNGQAADKILSSEATDPVLQLRSNDTPVIAMTQLVFRDGMNSTDIYMRRWDTSQNQWVDLGVPIDKNISFNARNPSFVLRTNNNPIISWDEQDETSSNVYVRQY